MIVSMVHDITYGWTASQRERFSYMYFKSDYDDSLIEITSTNKRLLFGCSIEMLLPCALFIIGLLGLLAVLPHTSFCSNAFYGGLLGSGITLIILETLFGFCFLRYKHFDIRLIKDFFNFNKIPTEPESFGDL